MEVIDLKLKGLKLIKPKVFQDNRGFFLETYRKELYEKHDIPVSFVQDNHSYSQKGSLRGMHFQHFPGQAKLIRVAQGKIYDVAVDIRQNSPTFGQWDSIVLDSEEHHQLFIPIGFAHGFCVLSEGAHVLYKTSSPYDSVQEKGFRWNDPTVNIEWPIKNPIVSARDEKSPLFQEVTFPQNKP